MAYEFTTQTTAEAVFDRIITFATANGWTLEQSYDASGVKGRALHSEGISEQESITALLFFRTSTATTPTRLIRVGGAAGLYHDTPSTAASEVDFYNQPSADAGPYHALWNGGTGDIPLHIWVNADRIAWCSRSDSRWMFAHVGILRRFGARAQVPYPLWLCGNTNATNQAWDNSAMQNWPIGTLSGSDPVRVLDAVGTWGGIGIQRALPYAHDLSWGGRNADGDYGLEEVVVYRTNGGATGTPYGIYYCSPEGLVSGNEIAIGGDDYIVFENVYRGQSGGFMAIIKE